MSEKEKRKIAVLFDCDLPNIKSFCNGLHDALKMEVNYFKYIANDCSKLKRYFLYFLKPLSFLPKIKSYKLIIAWQQFYGIMLLFFTRVLKIKKDIVLMNFIYIEKKTLLKNIYYKFVKFCISSKNCVKILVNSSFEPKDYSKLFKLDSSKFYYKKINFEINAYPSLKIEKGNYFVSAGRSNRDYDFLCNSFKKIQKDLYIISDTYKPSEKLPNNIRILSNCFGDEYFEIVSKCFACIVSLGDSHSSSGQLAIFDASHYNKPVIITDNFAIQDYLNSNCIVIKKDFESLKEAISSLDNDIYYCMKSVMADSNKNKTYQYAYDVGKELAQIN